MRVGSKKGFTLIEMMVAVTVMAVLILVGITIFTKFQEVGRDSKRIQDLGKIQGALETFYSTNRQTYPSEANYVASLSAYFERSAPPKDPKSDSDYLYYHKRPSGSCSQEKYILCAELENCGNKCTLSQSEIDNINSCTSSAGTPQSGKKYICKSSLSN